MHTIDDVRPVMHPRVRTLEAASRPRSLARPPQCAVVLNARAKRVSANGIAELRRTVGSQHLFVSNSLAEAEAIFEAVLDRGYELVMVGGGDGTVASTLELLDRLAQGRPIPDVGVLRLGTGNAVAGLVKAGSAQRDLQRALRGEGERTLFRTVEVSVEGRAARMGPFASLGYDAQVLNDYIDVVRERGPWFKSLAGYAVAAASRSIPAQWRDGATEVSVVSQGCASLLDWETGEEIPFEGGPNQPLFEGEARAVLMGTAPCYGYGMKVLPFAQRRLDRFHLRVSTASVGFILSRLPWLWNGSLKTRRFVDFLVEGASIRCRRAFPVQVAGDPEGRAQEVEIRLSQRRFCLRRMGGG